MNEFTHIDIDGHPTMVDISSKNKTLREAEASCDVIMPENVFNVVSTGNVSKGDVIRFAELAGIAGSKKTSELIPLCHNIRIDSSSVRCTIDAENFSIKVSCTVKASETTGVEMEALTGAMTAALTIYDMCKALDKGIIISNLRQE
jgi:cyclic pyranopterin phosphate synthase